MAIYCLYGISVWDDEKVLDIGSSTTMGIYLMTLKYTF